MKAFLLAAGEGTRLRPLTYTIPKCLVPIKGKPLIGIWLDLLKRHGITDILINLHHFSYLVAEYLGKNIPQGLTVNTSYEEDLLGSAGTVLANKEFVEAEEQFFIAYADNLTDVNLSKMLDFHKSHQGIFTMGLFRSNMPEQCGVVELDNEGLITSFVEKPKAPLSNLVNAGVFLGNKELFKYIPQMKADFGFDVLPKLVGKAYGYVINEYLLDIGSISNYKLALKTWENDYYPQYETSIQCESAKLINRPGEVC